MSGSGSITSYRDAKQLLKLRSLIFKDLYDHVSLRSAVLKISCWQSRGKLPHAVDVTACILSAIINDMNDSVEISLLDKRGPGSATAQLMLRNAYSMSLVRFVNGILDPFQQGNFATALSTLAKSIGLPYSFVELRHCATHESLPSLEILRATSREALQWLYDNFWTTLNSSSKPSPFVGNKLSFESIRMEVTSNLENFLPLLLSNSENQALNKTISRKGSEAAKYLKSIAENDQLSFELVRTLISKNYTLSISSKSVMLDENMSFLKNPRFLLQMIFVLLPDSQTENSSKLPSERPNPDSGYLSSLISMVKQGPFPFELHNKIYTCEEDVLQSVAVYNRLLQNLSNSSSSAFKDSTSKHFMGKSMKVPSLEDILNSSTTPATFKKRDSKSEPMFDTQRQSKKRRTNHFITQTCNWSTRPFAYRQRTAYNDD